jgi:hypothetical protein
VRVVYGVTVTEEEDDEEEYDQSQDWNLRKCSVVCHVNQIIFVIYFVVDVIYLFFAFKKAFFLLLILLIYSLGSTRLYFEAFCDWFL